MDFYLMWVAGTGMPKKVHETLEEAHDAVRAYKNDGGTRECYILKPIERIDGRKLITLKPKPKVEEKKIQQMNK